MNVLIKTATALGFILVIPLFALPAHSAPAYEAGHKPPHHRIADSANARALVSPGSYVPAPRKPETDGLSRNPDDCSKYGCIDNSGG
jgi:hypothetical protein